MLHSLELQDFKSYRGKQTIGPFYKFTAIIGPNGSGKSNLMEAICFVLGEKAGNLRVRKLTDLIHGAPIGKPVGKTCHVMAVFQDENGKGRKTFTRRVGSGGSEFLINGQLVQQLQYTQAMEEMKIFIKAKNFLVYQGQVEQIAMKNPKERTSLFEEISRSSDYAGDYERAKAEMQKAELEAQSSMNKRRGIAAEKREARLEREEAEKYQQQREELTRKQQLVQLMELFRVERNVNIAEKDRAEKKEIVNDLTAQRDALEEAQNEKQKGLKKVQKEFHKTEKAVTEKEREIGQKKPQWVQADQEVKHHIKKLEQAKKGYEASRKAADTNAENLKNFQAKETEIKAERAKKAAELDEISQQQQLNLSAAQIDEYIQLKKEAGKQAGVIDTQLANLVKEEDEDKAQIEYEQKRMGTLEDKCKSKKAEVERYRNQINNLADQKMQMESLVEDEDRNLVDMEKQVKKSKEDIEKVARQLDEVKKKLNDAHGDTMEGERERRRKEAVENLMRVFPDKVHGRLLDLCVPSHKRFQLALTKVLQKHMSSIVCDTEETGRDAIYYLKEQRYPPETFLPLNALEVHPINEKLRNLTRPKGAKLLYDVIQCTHHSAKKALQFACGNSLVCETPDDARFLAYGEAGDRYKAVALDGTLFNPTGPISGGGTELKKHARKWDEAGVRKMKEQSNGLNEELNRLHRTRKKELDVEMKRTSIKSIQHRLKYIDEQTKQTKTYMQRADNELDTNNGELELIPIRVNEIQETIEQRQKKINELREKTDKVANKVFADFCKRIGVHDIREYESRDMKFHEEKKAKLLEFDRELDRMKLEIDYLKQDEKENRARNEQDKVTRLEKELKTKKKKDKELKAALDTLEEELGDLQVKLKEHRAGMEEVEASVGDAKKESHAAAREVTQAEKAVQALENVILRWKSERHRLLHDAKINQISMPLSAGSMADVDAEEEAEEDEEMDHDGEPSRSKDTGDVTMSQVSKEQLKREDKIKINYRALPDDFRSLEEEEDMKKRIQRVNREIVDANDQLSKIQAPNLKANERLEDVKESEVKVNQSFERARGRAQKARREFEKIKTERYRRFNDCFEPVSHKIDEIYKLLSRDASAQAFLGADNMEEPYLEGIQYNCIAPGKRFRPMDNLSGGEKTVAALALLFAMHARNPSPFFVLDEIDAALDNTNIGKVASFIVDTARNDMQLIVISLKEEFYNKADGLVGIHPIPANCTVSGILTMDLSTFKTSGHDHTLSESTLASSER